MQYLNDDMDELFRRAAKDYPLDTTGANWGKVKTALENAPVEEAISTGNNNKRHLLWLFLLLPFGLICHRYYTESIPVEKQRTGETEIKVTPTEKDVTLMRSRKENVGRGPNIISLEEHSGTYLQSPTVAPNLKWNRTVPAKAIAVHDRHNLEQMNEGPIGQELVSNQSEPRPMEQHEVQKLGETAIAAPETKADQAKDSVSTTASPTPSSPKKPIRQQRFYAGVIGGLDVTTIKLQEINDVGFDLGLIAGFEISPRWSLEAGILSTEKAYYSEGKYFGKAQAYMPYGSKILDADGICRMLEVPVTVRYQFNSRKKGNWFASTGVTSYFMKNEYYDYTVWEQSTGQVTEKSWGYSNNTKHLMAAVQLSGGYQYKLGRRGALRIEPYLKVPVRNVGFYELPLTSAGLHVAITRKVY